MLVSACIVNMNGQKDKVTRDLDTNIYKIMDSYRQLLKKGQVNSAGEVSTHEQLQIETAATSIVSASFDIFTHVYLSLLSNCYICFNIPQSYHARAILDQIHDLRMHLLLQTANVEKETSESLV